MRAQAGVQLLYGRRDRFLVALSCTCKAEPARQSAQHSQEQCQTMPNNAANKTCSGAPRRAMAIGARAGPASQPQKKAPPWEIEERVQAADRAAKNHSKDGCCGGGCH